METSLKFQILDTNAEGDAWNRNRLKYQDHLKEKNMSGDLLKYFGQGFFHDGSISEIRFENGMNDLSFEIDCPNIRLLTGPGAEDYEYQDLTFTCKFEGVADFGVETRKIDQWNDPLSEEESKATFIDCELDTLLNEIEDSEKSNGGQFHSILIETSTGHRMIKIVFKEAAVIPRDVEKFEKWSKSENYHFPFFEPDWPAAD